MSSDTTVPQVSQQDATRDEFADLRRKHPGYDDISKIGLVWYCWPPGRTEPPLRAMTLAALAAKIQAHSDEKNRAAIPPQRQGSLWVRGDTKT